MSEYIEREALMKNFCGYDLTKCVKYGNESAEQQHDSYSTMMMYEIADEIEDAPTADVVSVVRCKDCKHRGDAPVCPMIFQEFIEWDDDGYMETDIIEHDRTEDDGFCQYGERNE